MRTPGLLLLAASIGCGSEKAVAPGPDAPVSPGPGAGAAEPGPVPGDRYEGSGTVLDKRGVGPQLCLGAVATSLPPQCGGIPLVGWDWAKVEGEQTAGETTWGEYRVVGTYDGTRMTPTEPPGPPQYPQETFTFESPCKPPAGGWARPDPKKMGREDLQRANEAAQKMPGYAGLWLFNLAPPREQQDPKDVVLNVAFKGELAKREAELRKLWGGALCMVERTRSEAEVGEIRAQAEAMVRELGLEMLMSDVDVVRGTIKIEVVAATPAQLARFDERFGAGVVVLSPRLRPLK